MLFWKHLEENFFDALEFLGGLTSRLCGYKNIEMHSMFRLTRSLTLFKTAEQYLLVGDSRKFLLKLLAMAGSFAIKFRVNVLMNWTNGQGYCCKIDWIKLDALIWKTGERISDALSSRTASLNSSFYL